MTAYAILIGLSLAVILSYIFNLAAQATRIPSVLLLLLTGIGLQQLSLYVGYAPHLPKTVLEIFGIIGLIMIVLEGALDLRLSRDKVPLIRRSFLAALAMLLGQAAAIGGLLHLWLGNASWQSCLLNAVPLVVISSAIAIPSVANLTGEKQEFIVYESTFSDILGIMLFNFFDQDDFAQGGGLLTFGRGVVLIVLVAIASTALLTFLLGRLRGHVKFFLLFSFLVLIYSLAKKLHLSSLLLVLAFGLVVNNYDLLLGSLRHRLPRLRLPAPATLEAELHQLKNITAESAFLIRTFFFLLFGYSISLPSLLSLPLIGAGVLVVTVLTAIRFLYLRYVAKTDLLPELFIAPKGLITVLLFYSIPAAHQLGGVSENILFIVILLTSLLMMFGLILSHQRPTTEVEF